MDRERASVLVVDDDESWLELCVAMLTHAGFEVVAAPDGGRALDAIALRPFDIVLTDLMMPPPNDGRAVTAGVKARRPETDVILMTATPSLDSAVTVLKDGAYDYILKPFKQDYLLAVLERCLQKRRSQRELSVERQLREELQAAYGELKKAERLKEAFLARLSHELNTPLAATQMALTLLEHEVAGDEKKSARARLARESAERLHAVIADLLDFVDIQRPDLALELGPVALGELAREAAEAGRKAAESRQLRVALEFPPDLPALRGDRRLLGRALRQLFLNGVHFNAQGGLLELRGAAWEDRVVLTVRDQGEGIPQEQREAVFDSFYQIADYMTRRVGGVGLGLAIVKKIVEAHDGTVAVDNADDGGARFRVTLPVAGPRTR